MAHAHPSSTTAATASRDDLEAQLNEAREEAELTLLQLHQVQEELEHYFLAHQDAEAKLQRYRLEQQRAEALIEALLARLEARGR